MSPVPPNCHWIQPKVKMRTGLTPSLYKHKIPTCIFLGCNCSTPFASPRWNGVILALSHRGRQTMDHSPSSLPPVFVNKILLAHSPTHSFIYCVRLLSHHNGWVEWVYDRDSLTHQAENSYYRAPTERACHPLQMEGRLAPSTMLSWKHVRAYSIVTCTW